MKLITIVGARPQFIKAATVSRIVALQHDVTEMIVHTGQHFDANMSDIFFDELQIPKPHAHLGIGGGSHGAMTGRQLEAIEQVLIEERPDWVLVYGDTNSTLAGALAAVKLKVPVAHVEAGLRSFNRAMPEEINRVVTDHVADLLFIPTRLAGEHLAREGLDAGRIVYSGDVMCDAALFYAERARQTSTVLERLALVDTPFLLVTLHRAENMDDPTRLDAIASALCELALTHRIVLPIHPRTRIALERVGRLDALRKHLTLIDPVGYLDMVRLESAATLIATDSGGVQKEAYFHRVPCVTLRTETEWVELIDSGWNCLAAPNETDTIVATIESRIGQFGETTSLYGQGNAAETIVATLRSR